MYCQMGQVPLEFYIRFASQKGQIGLAFSCVFLVCICKVLSVVGKLIP